MIFLCFLGIFSQFEACQDRLGLTKRFSKDIFNVPDLGRVAPGWWRLSHISEGQNNSLFIPAWLLLCAHAWFMPWTHGLTTGLISEVVFWPYHVGFLQIYF